MTGKGFWVWQRRWSEQPIVWLLLIVFFSAGTAAGQKFFQTEALDRCNPKLDSCRTERYSKVLGALNEPSLFEAKQDQTLQSYRFVWLRAFHHPIAIRVLIHPDGRGTLVTKVADGAVGDKPGRLIVNKTELLLPQQVSRLLDRIQHLGYWTLPSSDPNPPGLDGAQWIIEGVDNGKYHVVDRWSPKAGPVRELGLCFLRELSKLQHEEIY